MEITLHNKYKSILKEIKEKIKSAQIRASLSVNSEVIQLYWDIGKRIIDSQKQNEWGSGFLKNLSQDLRNSFPETEGFSVSNLDRMKKFYLCYSDLTISAQAVRKLPWGHIISLIEKVKDTKERDWYIVKTFEEGWSRETLVKYIMAGLYKHQALSGEKVSNYLEKLPEPQGALAHDLIKNPYNFGFLNLQEDAYEREIEQALTKQITKFILELGKGFAFIGSQVPIELEGQEYFLDMLFYHTKLHCYIVVEIKATKLKADHAGQLNFYLNLVDDFIKTPQDNPTIGLLLCKERSKVFAEYILRGITKPIGISEYALTKAIPKNIKTNLPSIEQIEEELSHLEEPEKTK